MNCVRSPLALHLTTDSRRLGNLDWASDFGDASIVRETVRPTALERTPERRPRMDLPEVVCQLGLARVDDAALCGGLDRKAHLNIGGCELIAREPFALAQFAFHEIELTLQVGI